MLRTLLRAVALAAALLLAIVPALGEALPAPAGDLSFLTPYVDAVRVGDWFLACVEATAPEENFDSATRNTSAPWVLLDESGAVLADGLCWWPKDEFWPLQPQPFEGFEEGADTAVLRVGQKYGLIDRQGRITVAPQYDSIFGIRAGDTSTPAMLNHHWGCIDTAGHVVAPFVYDYSFRRFEGGCTVANRDGKYALLGEDGGEILPAVYDGMWLDDGAPYGMARQGDVVALFDRAGNILFERALGKEAWVYCYPDAELPFAYYDGAHCGYINLDGSDALPPLYDDAAPFWQGTDAASVQMGDKFGLIRRDGSFALPAEYDAPLYISEGLYAAKKDGLWGYLDADGQTAIPFQFAWAGDFHNGYADASPREDDALHGLIDRSGRWVIEPMACDNISVGPDGVAVASGQRAACFRLTEDGAEEIAGLADTHGYADMNGRLPHEDASNLAKLDGEKALLSDERLPHLDGEGRLYPLYAAYVEALYPQDVKYEAWDFDSAPILTISSEDNPWQRLSDGGADILFVGAPDPEASLWATLAARGQEAEFIPLCRDAVVFLVHADNPVEAVSADALAAVYAGEITQWDALGGDAGAIVAYQDYASGAARASFERLCAFDALMDAPEGITGYDSWGDEVTTGAVAYRNLPGALGYARWSECQALLASGAVKALAVDGVTPTPESIASGAYPYVETLYAVALKDNVNANVAALLEWIQSEQGAELARKSGFIPLGK